jgi:hypothetical protein
MSKEKKQKYIKQLLASDLTHVSERTKFIELNSKKYEKAAILGLQNCVNSPKCHDCDP